MAQCTFRVQVSERPRLQLEVAPPGGENKTYLRIHSFREGLCAASRRTLYA